MLVEPRDLIRWRDAGVRRPSTSCPRSAAWCSPTSATRGGPAPCSASRSAQNHQGILIGPAFALALWQSDRTLGIARAALAACGVVLLIILPFALKGAVAQRGWPFGSFDARRDTMSTCAANIGWDHQLGAAPLAAVPRSGAHFLEPSCSRYAAASGHHAFPRARLSPIGRSGRVAVTHSGGLGSVGHAALTRAGHRRSRRGVHDSRILRVERWHPRTSPIVRSAASRPCCGPSSRFPPSCWLRRQRHSRAEYQLSVWRGARAWRQRAPDDHRD